VKKMDTAIKKNPIFFFITFTFLSIFSVSRSYAEVSIGDSYGGGTVFCVSKTPDITQCVTQGSGNYGLIMANEDQVNFDSNPEHGVSWASKYDVISAARSDDDGLANTASIIKAYPKDNPSNNAAWLTHDYNKAHGQDADQYLTIWYLPAKNELNKMYLYAKANNLIGKNCVGRKAGGVQCLIGGYSSEKNGDSEYKIYWSSTEYSGNNNDAWLQYFTNDGQDYDDKIDYYFGVRAVRAFNNSIIQQFNNVSLRPDVIAGALVVMEKTAEQLLYNAEQLLYNTVTNPETNAGGLLATIQHLNVNAQILVIVAAHPNVNANVLLAIAQNPITSSSGLNVIVRDPNVNAQTLAAVAAHPNATANILLAVVRNPAVDNVGIRSAITHP
jgi:hypothetical protein